MRFISLTILAGFIITASVVTFTAIFIYAKVKTTLHSLFGFSDLARLTQYTKDVEEQIANTPKSVSGMTSVYLPRIQADFPYLNWAEFQEMAADGVREYCKSQGYDALRIHRYAINDYKKSAGTCYVIIQYAAEYRKSSKLTQSRFNVTMSYVMDATLAGDSTSFALNCPNCGSPITMLGQKHCQYCGTAIIEVDRNVWNMQRVEELR